MKVVLLTWYSQEYFGFRKIESFLASKIDFEIWKYLIFDGTASNCLVRYKHILSVCSFECKNVLNFTCLLMNFHDHGHPDTHEWAQIFWLKKFTKKLWSFYWVIPYLHTHELRIIYYLYDYYTHPVKKWKVYSYEHCKYLHWVWWHIAFTIKRC